MFLNWNLKEINLLKNQNALNTSQISHISVNIYIKNSEESKKVNKYIPDFHTKHFHELNKSLCWKFL